MSLDTGQRILTPTTGRVARRGLFWIAVALFVGIIVVLSIGAIGSQSGGVPLDSENPAPDGAMAVAEVLRQQGVTVTATSSLDETREAITDAAATTLFVYDDGLYLSDAQWREVAALADRVIIADPSFMELAVVAPELAQAGFVDGTREADCDVAAVQKAGSVSGDGSGYRIVDESSDVTGCLTTDEDVYSLVQLDRGDRIVTVLGATGALTNGVIVEAGNAALALNLLGEHESLVWYLPSFEDAPQSAPSDLGSLTPPWVTPALALLVLTFVAAAVWRGRRLGPLVIENLPVTVRASETMLGRARLYEKSNSRLRALDALRIGSLQRLATHCGLPRTATVDDVAAATAAATGKQLSEVRRVLLDAVPGSDAELLRLSDALLELERDLAAAVRP